MGFLNSLLAIQLILYIEKEFDISVSNNVLIDESLHTIDGICDYIYGTTSKK